MTNYTTGHALADAQIAYVLSKGIVLENYYGIIHHSQHLREHIQMNPQSDWSKAWFKLLEPCLESAVWCFYMENNKHLPEKKRFAGGDAELAAFKSVKAPQ